MSAIDSVSARLADGQLVLLDGATGTELERRGVPMDGAAWSAAALVTHPDTIRSVHQDYIRAGASIITSNSFSTARHQLEPAGLGARFRELNHRAVELAREARATVTADRPIAVAGSMSSIHFEREYMVPVSTAEANFREQAEVLAEAGPDLILMEMMWDLEYSAAAVRAAAATGLPVWVGFTARRDGDAIMLFSEKYTGTLESALAPVLSAGGSLVSVMHTEAVDVAAALEVVKGSWSGPLGAYGHSGRFVMPNWQFNDVISPEAYLAEARTWVAAGARLIGGCCGIGPDHIRLLAEQLHVAP